MVKKILFYFFGIVALLAMFVGTFFIGRCTKGIDSFKNYGIESQIDNLERIEREIRSRVDTARKSVEITVGLVRRTNENNNRITAINRELQTTNRELGKRIAEMGNATKDIEGIIAEIESILADD
jgi:preprotein translocase subunit SecF